MRLFAIYFGLKSKNCSSPMKKTPNSTSNFFDNNFVRFIHLEKVRFSYLSLSVFLNTRFYIVAFRRFQFGIPQIGLLHFEILNFGLVCVDEVCEMDRSKHLLFLCCYCYGSHVTHCAIF